jgi:Ser/Thr protein kinase RdoA (MazF antagonist)
MQPARINAICQVFGLGRPTGQPIRIAGAMSNSNWRVRTERGSFFLKLLNWGEAGPDWRVSYERRFRLEQAALAAGMDAPRPILAPSGGCLAEIPVLGEAPLVVRAHHWVDGVGLSPGPASPEDAAQIGRVYAKIHALHLEEAADPEQVLPIYPLEDWIQREREFPELRGIVPLMNRLRTFVLAGRDLVGRTLLCHHDINSRNVLRAGDGRLFILDWELAGPLDPKLDVETAILVWSGAWEGEPDWRAARALIQAYREAGGEFEAGGRRVICFLARWARRLAVAQLAESPQRTHEGGPNGRATRTRLRGLPPPHCPRQFRWLGESFAIRLGLATAAFVQIKVVIEPVGDGNRDGNRGERWRTNGLGLIYRANVGELWRTLANGKIRS